MKRKEKIEKKRKSPFHENEENRFKLRKKSIKNLKNYNNKWEHLFINIFNVSTKEQAPKSQPLCLYLLGQLCVFFATFHISPLSTHVFFFFFFFWYNFACNKRLLIHILKNFWILFTRLLFNCLHFNSFALSHTIFSSVSQGVPLRVKRRHIVVTPKYVSICSPRTRKFLYMCISLYTIQWSKLGNTTLA